MTLPLVVPPGLGDIAEIFDEFRAKVAAREAQAAAERQRTGRSVLGCRAVRRQAWRAAPTTREPRRNLRPQVAARSRWARIEALRRNRAFVAAYRDARSRWVAGQLVTFPAGTYWLRRFANVPHQLTLVRVVASTLSSWADSARAVAAWIFDRRKPSTVVAATLPAHAPTLVGQPPRALFAHFRFLNPGPDLPGPDLPNLSV